MSTATSATISLRSPSMAANRCASKPMPARFALGEAEIAQIQDVIAYYQEKQVDPGYGGAFEKRYTDAFVKFMGGGYADAVATGTASLYIAVAALDLPPDSEVIVSPVTDPGNAVVDHSQPLGAARRRQRAGTFNMGPEQFVARITPKTRAVMLVHSLGRAADVAGVVKEAHARDIRVIEDCSQSHGARVKGRPIGNFGDIAAFSTMYRKAHMTGGAGGVVFTNDIDLHHRALAMADRGKPSWRPDFDDRNPNQFLFPALNFHTDEISCAIGVVLAGSACSDTLLKRLTFLAEVTGRLNDRAKICKPFGYTPNDAPFVYPIVVDIERITCSKEHFANAVLAEGIGLNPHYRYLVSDWPWLKRYLPDDFNTPNARSTPRPVVHALSQRKLWQFAKRADCSKAIVKVEKHFNR